MTVKQRMTTKMEARLKAEKAPESVFNQTDDDKAVTSVSSAKNTKVFTQAERWHDMFNRLEMYRKKNGDCLVPKFYDEDPKLGYWVAEQRQKFKGKGPQISETNLERKQKLDRIGFEWTVAKCVRSTWQSRFEQLLEFVINHGHAHVPIGWEENEQLAHWVSRQRRDRKALEKNDGCSSHRLTQERIDLLNSVGFIWESQRGGLKRSRSGSCIPLPEPLVGKTLPPKVLRKHAGKLLQRYRPNRMDSSESVQRSEVGCVLAGAKEATDQPAPSFVSKRTRKRKIQNSCAKDSATNASRPRNDSTLLEDHHVVDAFAIDSKLKEEGKSQEPKHTAANADDVDSVRSDDEDSKGGSVGAPLEADMLCTIPYRQQYGFPWQPIQQAGICYGPLPVYYVPFSPFSPLVGPMPPFGYPAAFPYAMGSLGPAQLPFLPSIAQLNAPMQSISRRKRPRNSMT